MAPPSTRRPGFSRRAQYGLFLRYVAAAAGILLALLLLLIAIVDRTGSNAARSVMLDVTAPISSAGRGVVRFFGVITDGIGDYFRAGSQNAELKRQVAVSRRKLIEAQATAYENKRLKRLLGLTQAVDDEVAVARIVGSSFDSTRRFATLSAGTANGVRPGQPVRSADGLVGRVLESGRYASRILLVTDGANNVPVRLVRDGTPAIATGRGDGTIDLKTLEVGRNPFRRGDILVTSGTGGVYPPGVPVAVVVLVRRDSTVARPTADPARIDFAIVQPIYQPAAVTSAP